MGPGCPGEKIMRLSSNDLDEFIRAVDGYGGDIYHPELAEKYYPIELEFATAVDQTLSPFSEDYFLSQIRLYEEISGRKLNQWEGELHPGDHSHLLTAPNPQGLSNITEISERVRALSLMLSLSFLENNAQVLDLGAGHGVSSEVYAFCGCRVHAIDIDPVLADLSMQRSIARNFPITRTIMNFDDLSLLPDESYAAAYFFQSLHHCLRPWKLIEELKNKLTPDGVIGFTGEPIQDFWWKDWGIRLDQEALYAARKYGWFESGWTDEFIKKCFKMNGLELHLLKGGHRKSKIGITSKSRDKLAAIIKQAELFSLPEELSFEIKRLLLLLRKYAIRLSKKIAKLSR